MHAIKKFKDKYSVQSEVEEYEENCRWDMVQNWKQKHLEVDSEKVANETRSCFYFSELKTDGERGRNNLFLKKEGEWREKKIVKLRKMEKIYHPLTLSWIWRWWFWSRYRPLEIPTPSVAYPPSSESSKSPSPELASQSQQNPSSSEDTSSKLESKKRSASESCEEENTTSKRTKMDDDKKSSVIDYAVEKQKEEAGSSSLFELAGDDF